MKQKSDDKKDDYSLFKLIMEVGVLVLLLVAMMRAQSGASVTNRPYVSRDDCSGSIMPYKPAHVPEENELIVVEKKEKEDGKEDDQEKKKQIQKKKVKELNAPFFATLDVDNFKNLSIVETEVSQVSFSNAFGFYNEFPFAVISTLPLITSGLSSEMFDLENSGISMSLNDAQYRAYEEDIKSYLTIYEHRFHVERYDDKFYFVCPAMYSNLDGHPLISFCSAMTIFIDFQDERVISNIYSTIDVLGYRNLPAILIPFTIESLNLSYYLNNTSDERAPFKAHAEFILREVRLISQNFTNQKKLKVTKRINKASKNSSTNTIDNRLSVKNIVAGLVGAVITGSSSAFLVFFIRKF